MCSPLMFIEVIKNECSKFNFAIKGFWTLYLYQILAGVTN